MTRAEPARPFADTKTANFIDQRIEHLKSVKSQRDIALAMGFKTPNVLSMIKRGETKLPLDKVQALATAMDVDPAHLLRLALEDYLPTLAAAFESLIGHVATENEWEGLLKPWRKATRDTDPALTDMQTAALGQFMKEIHIDIAKVEPQ
jgi:transcriptional regulator with XRE-family HTH domain